MCRDLVIDQHATEPCMCDGKEVLVGQYEQRRFEHSTDKFLPVVEYYCMHSASVVHIPPC